MNDKHKTQLNGMPALLRTKLVLQGLSIGRTTLAELMKKGMFPKPVRLGKTPVWRRTDIEKYIDSLEPQEGRK
jgi:prophage regulatory protein